MIENASKTLLKKRKHLISNFMKGKESDFLDTHTHLFDEYFCDSFEKSIGIAALGTRPFPAVFIRAPVISQIGSNVKALSHLEDDTVIAARQGRLLATTFHPELTEDTRLHSYFLNIVSGNK